MRSDPIYSRRRVFQERKESRITKQCTFNPSHLQTNYKPAPNIPYATELSKATSSPNIQLGEMGAEVREIIPSAASEGTNPETIETREEKLNFRPLVRSFLAVLLKISAMKDSKKRRAEIKCRNGETKQGRRKTEERTQDR